MIKNYIIPPHPDLLAFVDNYILSTSENKIITIKSYWPASNETSLLFNLAGLPEHHYDEHTSSLFTNKHQCVVGLLTHCNGIVQFNGIYNTFIIQFKANGFGKLFRMSGSAVTNQIIAADDIFGKQTNNLYERLLNASDIQQMACFADSFLLSFLNRHKKTATVHDGITVVSKELYNTTQLLSVSQYAYKANMSIRNFERRFMEQVGVSPKFYIRLVRFNEVMRKKAMHPAKSWTSVAHECGYYDQMHMIKDFKQFADSNPSDFFHKDAGSTRPGVGITDPYPATSYLINNNLPEEEFIFVRRTHL